MTESLYLLLPLSVLFVIGIGAAFWWAIFSGQFDDTERASELFLMDDDNPQPLHKQDGVSNDADSTSTEKSD